MTLQRQGVIRERKGREGEEVESEQEKARRRRENQSEGTREEDASCVQGACHSRCLCNVSITCSTMPCSRNPLIQHSRFKQRLARLFALACVKGSRKLHRAAAQGAVRRLPLMAGVRGKQQH